MATRMAKASTSRGRTNSEVQRARDEDPYNDPEDAVHNLDEAYLECRDLRHPWQLMGYFRIGSAVARQLSCPKCHTIRKDVWTAGGERLSSGYTYPEGYQVKGSGGGIRPDMVRREVLSRVEANIYDSEHSMFENMVQGTKRRSRNGNTAR